MADDFFGRNEFLDSLEASKPYREIQKLIEKALFDQWQDATLSGLVNILFDRYKDFFINRRGVKTKIRKAEGDDDEVTSVDDLKEQELATLQGDRIIVGERALLMVPLLLFLRREVDKNTKSVSSFYRSKSSIQNYLKLTASKAGQTIIDQIKTPKPIKFRLSNRGYINKINERVSKMTKGVDKVTKKRLTRQLALGIRKGETKAQLVRRLDKMGKQFAKNRAKRIVATETQAITEFIRFETARINGVKEKIWKTAEDERVCPICAPLHNQRIGMTVTFESGEQKQTFTGQHPPAHVLCRCWIEYVIREDAYLEFIKARPDLSDKLDDLKKKADPLKYTRSDINAGKITNPNAVWAGGESLVGPDKSVGNFFEELKDVPPADISESLQTKDGQLVIVDIPQFSTNQTAITLQEARDKLSDIGFVQLLLSLGIRKKIPAKPNQ